MNITPAESLSPSVGGQQPVSTWYEGRGELGAQDTWVGAFPLQKVPGFLSIHGEQPAPVAKLHGTHFVYMVMMRG